MTVCQKVGRLCEVVYRPPFDKDQLTSFTISIRSLVNAATERVVFFVDWRGEWEFSSDMIDTIVWIMRRDNPMIEANGILISRNNTPLRTQVERIVREANSSQRRVFDRPQMLVDWLHPRLSSAERARLQALIDEGDL